MACDKCEKEACICRKHCSCGIMSCLCDKLCKCEDTCISPKCAKLRLASEKAKEPAHSLIQREQKTERTNTSGEKRPTPVDDLPTLPKAKKSCRPLSYNPTFTTSATMEISPKKDSSIKTSPEKSHKRMLSQQPHAGSSIQNDPSQKTSDTPLSGISQLKTSRIDESPPSVRRPSKRKVSPGKKSPSKQAQPFEQENTLKKEEPEKVNIEKDESSDELATKDISVDKKDRSGLKRSPPTRTSPSLPKAKRPHTSPCDISNQASNKNVSDVEGPSLQKDCQMFSTGTSLEKELSQEDLNAESSKQASSPGIPSLRLSPGTSCQQNISVTSSKEPSPKKESLQSTKPSPIKTPEKQYQKTSHTDSPTIVKISTTPEKEKTSPSDQTSCTERSLQKELLEDLPAESSKQASLAGIPSLPLSSETSCQQNISESSFKEPSPKKSLQSTKPSSTKTPVKQYQKASHSDSPAVVKISSTIEKEKTPPEGDSSGQASSTEKSLQKDLSQRDLPVESSKQVILPGSPSLPSTSGTSCPSNISKTSFKEPSPKKSPQSTKPSPVAQRSCQSISPTVVRTSPIKQKDARQKRTSPAGRPVQTSEPSSSSAVEIPQTGPQRVQTGPEIAPRSIRNLLNVSALLGIRFHEGKIVLTQLLGKIVSEESQENVSQSRNVETNLRAVSLNTSEGRALEARRHTKIADKKETLSILLRNLSETIRSGADNLLNEIDSCPTVASALTTADQQGSSSSQEPRDEGLPTENVPKTNVQTSPRKDSKQSTRTSPGKAECSFQEISDQSRQQSHETNTSLERKDETHPGEVSVIDENMSLAVMIEKNILLLKLEEVQAKHDMLKLQVDELKAKENELEAKKNELEAKKNDLEAKKNESEAKEVELEAELNSLRSELNRKISAVQANSPSQAAEDDQLSRKNVDQTDYQTSPSKDMHSNVSSQEASHQHREQLVVEDASVVRKDDPLEYLESLEKMASNLGKLTSSNTENAIMGDDQLPSTSTTSTEMPS